MTRAERPSETRAQQVLPWGNWGNSLQSVAGVSVTTDSALQLLTVYGCVTLISDTIATLPRDIYRTTPSGVSEEVKVKPAWLEQPNDRTDIIEFLTQTLSSLLLDGNAYWAYSVDGNFLPTELHVLDPAKVDVRPVYDRSQQVTGVGYFINGERFNGRLLHIKGLTRAGALKGLSPIESAMQSIGLGLGAQKFAGQFYANGVTMSGYVTTPGALTKEQARDLRENISRDHGGLNNAHLPGVLTNGATWTSNSVTPEQAQFLQTREYQAAEIAAQLFLLDPSMLGIASAGTRGQNLTYANLEQRGIHLVQFTLLRWIIRLERAFTFLLPRPQYLKLNVDGLQRADLLTRMNAHRIALGPTQPFETVNEARDLEDLPPVPDGDVLGPATVPPAFPPQDPPGSPTGGADT